MSSFSKSTHNYSRKHQRAILNPWRQRHNLPPSPPSPSPNRNTLVFPIATNSPPSLSPPQNPSPNQIAHKLHHLSNLFEINHQQEIETTNPSPPTSLYIPPPSLDQPFYPEDEEGRGGYGLVDLKAKVEVTAIVTIS
ncbi:hypothetical protein Tco_1034761 [Tanacetum coccineum]